MSRVFPVVQLPWVLRLTVPMNKTPFSTTVAKQIAPGPLQPLAHETLLRGLLLFLLQFAGMRRGTVVAFVIVVQVQEDQWTFIWDFLGLLGKLKASTDWLVTNPPCTDMLCPSTATAAH
jgi:hypothetical protein